MEDKSMVVEMDTELNNTLQYLYYMVGTYKEVVKDILSNKRNINANKELLDYYNKELIDYSTQFKALQEETVANLCDIPEGKRAVYYMDFVKQCIYIQEIIDINEK